MKLFVWDFHGVLEKDNDCAVLEYSNEALEKLGFAERFDEETCRKLSGLKWFQYFEHLLPNQSHETHLRIQEVCLEIQQLKPEIIAKHLKPTDNARQVLQKIKSRHHQILISNTRESRMNMFINAVGLGDFFNETNTFAVDAHTQQQFTKKDALRDFLKNKAFERIIIIGDSTGDIELASVAGGTTYLYAHPGRPHKDCQADFKINDLREILKEI